MYCTKYCTCSLCRELRGFQASCGSVFLSNENNNIDNHRRLYDIQNKSTQWIRADNDRAEGSNDNFILKRRSSDIDDPIININKQNIPRHPLMDHSGVTKYQKPISLAKSKSYNELWKRFDPRPLRQKQSKNNKEISSELRSPKLESNNPQKKVDQHKVIIYFGDSLQNKKKPTSHQQLPQEPLNSKSYISADNNKNKINYQLSPQFKRQLNRASTRNNSVRMSKSLISLNAVGTNEKFIKNITEEIVDPINPEIDVMKQLKSVLEEKMQRKPTDNSNLNPKRMDQNNNDLNCAFNRDSTSSAFTTPPPPPPPPPPIAMKEDGNRKIKEVEPVDRRNTVFDKSCEVKMGNDVSLPKYIESIVNGIINIRIDDSYEHASQLIRTINEESNSQKDVESSNENFDWSFVQDWRAGPSGTGRTELPQFTSASSPSNQISETNNITLSNSSVNTPSTTAIQSNVVNTTKQLSPINNHYQQTVGSANNHSHSNNVPTGRIQNPAVATLAPRISKEVAYKPDVKNSSPTATYPQHCTPIPNASSMPNSGSFIHAHPNEIDDINGSPNNTNLIMIPERDTCTDVKLTSCTYNGTPQRSISGPAKLTIQSTPVKSQPPMLSSSLTAAQKNRPDTVNCSTNGSGKGNNNYHPLPNSPQSLHSTKSISAANLAMRTHHHAGAHDFRALQRVHECQSSSDENRSSGHASMSDTGHGSSSPGGPRSSAVLGPLPEDRLAAGVTNRSSRSRASTGHSRSRQRSTPAKVPWGGGGLEDIKLAIQQLTMRSQTSTSTYSSLSAGSESSEPVRRLGRYSSLETVNTNVTNADEFVWVDSHNRLVELQHPPWSQHCVLRVIRAGRCRDHVDRVSAEAVPRLGYLLQRALVRVAREVQRLSSGLGLCSKHEVSGAFKIVLCPALADSCTKACLRAAAMFAVPGDGALRQSKSARAGLQLPVGRFHRWMADARLGNFVHEYAAVYLCAGLENLLEEVLLQCLPSDGILPLTSTGLEHSIASSGDLWGLLQPYAHLNAGRVASGALTMPRWASQSSIGSNTGSHNLLNSSMEPCLLTTCVGSVGELKDLVLRAQNKFYNTTLSHAALTALFYFMRCSQLEHNDIANNNVSNGAGSNNVQELCYERAYVVLPPLVEWLRVASAHADYRHSILIDKDDIMQAARLLLPGVDCPPRSAATEEELPSKKANIPGFINASPQQSHNGSFVTANNPEEMNECGRRAALSLAFRLMLSARTEFLLQANTLLPSQSRYDTLNQCGLSALMVAALRNDDMSMQMLLEAGADPNIEVPQIGTVNAPAIHPETQHWTAVTFAACRGNYQAVRILLERGAHVEGGARLSEDKCTLTPLQVASGAGSVEVVSLLLAHGAHAFLSTQQKDSLCFSGQAQRGCYSAISVAAAHGQRSVLRKLLSHPLAPGSREILSLEEMLAEGDNSTRNSTDRQNETTPTLNKTQIKCLQEAMYHSAENNHLDITVELRALGVPWTLHCWMHALAAAHELRLDAVIDQLLQDFLQVCPDDYSSQFVTECLPLLFNIFRYSKKEGTTLLLADIFATCFGWESIRPIKEPVLQPINGSRIDPKFVNNPELSDVMFRVEGKIFYGHKIVLVTASPRLQSMLSSKLTDGNTPTVQINDIRYHIFQLVMQFLYSGGCGRLDVASGDILELMAAASFFQLDGLLRYTEARCAHMIDIDNVVGMYIHAKVYNAPKLMEFCQGFLLQNMVALLTYDDSVKRLLFAKKIPNHDVLSGLLTTLQARIKARRTATQSPSANITRPATVTANKIIK